jgi:catechol 2,3-dioxygenase-like lactoylglutathione lyase family enzyme
MHRKVSAQLSHIGFLARDLDRMIDFYSRVLGLVVTDRGPYRMGGEIVFLSGSTEEHHQVVFVSGRKDDEHKSILNQISFHVESLEDLRAFHKTLVAEEVKELAPRNHGNAWSIYFHDPDGNRVELYTPSPWYVAQPFGKELDLTEPAQTIIDKTEAMVRVSPGFCTREAWEERLAGRLQPH